MVCPKKVGGNARGGGGPCQEIRHIWRLCRESACMGLLGGRGSRTIPPPERGARSACRRRLAWPVARINQMRSRLPERTFRSTTMYAVIESGGKQHRVVEGETLKLEKLEVGAGDSISFDKVLLVGEGAEVKIGAPYLDSGKVTAEVVSHGRGEKVRIIKFKRRKHHLKRMGHRQWYTEVKITGISA